MDEIITKVCSKCKAEKSLDFFSTDKKSKDGKFCRCKKCESGRLKEYYVKKADKIKATVSSYYSRNRDKILFYNKNVRKKADPEKMHKYYEENKQKVLENVYNWKGRNKDKRKLYNYRRRGAVGSYTKDEWNGVLEKYNHTCLCCGRTGIPLSVDHVIPISSGGTSNIDNLQPLCKSCNSRKNTKTIDYRK